MKSKYIIGAVIIIGNLAVIAYLIYKSNKKKDERDKNFDIKSSRVIKDVIPVQEKDIDNNSIGDMKEAISDFIENKTGTIDTFSVRHQDAAKMMEESLKHIVEEASSEEFKSDNAGDLDEIDGVLDSLLDE